MLKRIRPWVAVLCLLTFPKTAIASGSFSLPQKSAIKIPGKYGSPQAELQKGNVKGAKLSCLQQSVNKIPGATQAYVWEYVNSGPSSVPSKLSSIAGTDAASSALGDSTSKPVSLQVSACDDDRKKACIELLDKAMTEESQAYYHSEANSDEQIWNNIASFLGVSLSKKAGSASDVSNALLDLTANDDPAMIHLAREALFAVAGQDPLLTATQLLIQAIDQALALGDVDRAAKGKLLLQRINPSAAHAVECVLSYLPNQGLNTKANPILTGTLTSNASKVGPLTGVDYGKMEELKTHGWIPNAIAAVGAIAAVATFVYMVYQTRKAEIKDYSECKEPAAVCDIMYPYGSVIVKEARKKALNAIKESEANSTRTAGPEKPIEKDIHVTEDPFAPFVKENCAGCGAAGGEIIPFDERIPVNAGAIASSLKAAQKLLWKHLDPSAGERLCPQVNKDFGKFVIQKIANSGRPFDNDGDMSNDLLLPIPLNPGSVAAFDRWTAAFWTAQKSKLGRPSNQDDKNNCNAMDSTDIAL